MFNDNFILTLCPSNYEKYFRCFVLNEYICLCANVGVAIFRIIYV